MADNIAQEVLDAQNLDRAVRLRVKGAHWDEIAARCGFSSPAAALRAVGEAMAAATQRATETADQMRDTANLQLDSLMREAWTMLEESAPETYDAEGNPLVSDDRAVKLRAVDEIRRLVESKAKLNKLDARQSEADDSSGIRILGVAISDVV